MNSKSYLLPYCFQKIGWGLFFFSFVFLGGSLLAFNSLKLFNGNHFHYAVLIIALILIFSAFFVAFSKEKNEDELIMRIRYSSVVITAYLGFILYMIMLIIYQINTSFKLLPRTIYGAFSFFNPLTLFFIYVFIFRARLFIFNRGIKNEE